jgi:hypothetical protein
MVSMLHNSGGRCAADASSRQGHRNPFSIAVLTVALAALALTAVGPSIEHAASGRHATGVSMVSKVSGRPSVTSAASSLLPPNNPASNISPNPYVFDYCSGAGIDESSRCQTASLQAIDNARASEGLPPMELPADWASLSPAEQLFVATNLERTVRGLPVFSGMSSELDSVAMSAANAGTDATPPSGFPAPFWTSNWAGGVGSPLEAIYLWMYDDGPGSPNVDCQPGSNTSGCWGHRDDILASFDCSPCVMGSAASSRGYTGQPSWAELMVDTTGSPALAFSWSAVISASSATVVGMTANAAKGYWLVTASGTVRAFGGAPNYGSASIPSGEWVVGIAAAPDSLGYWLVTSNGAVYAFGRARFYGGANGFRLSAPIVGLTGTPDGDGYWLVASDGGVFSYGDARFHGSTGNLRLNKPVVGMASTSNGGGYWLVASDGGIFSFGDATFHGSTGNLRLNKPVVGMTPAYRGTGYWLVASDGGIFSFGTATYHGSTGGMRLAAPVVGMASPESSGYWLVASDGGIFSFGVPFHGSMA